jgi:hypothetical protein
MRVSCVGLVARVGEIRNTYRNLIGNPDWKKPLKTQSKGKAVPAIK